MAFEQIPVTGTFDMGRVVKETFGAFRKHIVAFSIAAFVLAGIPQAMAQIGINVSEPEELLKSPLYLIGLISSALGGYMLQGYVVHVVVQGHQGSDAEVSNGLSIALSKAFPLLVLAILWNLGVVLGTVLFVIPGIILAVSWSVSVPILVIEGGGPISALQRSRELTKGARLKILGLMIVGILISSALSFAVSGFSLAALAADNMALTVPQTIAAVVVSSLTAIAFSCGAASIYSELRMIKEGVSNEQLASVFG